VHRLATNYAAQFVEQQKGWVLVILLH